MAGTVLSIVAYIGSAVDIAYAGNATALGWIGLGLSWIGLAISALQEQRRADRAAGRRAERRHLTERLAVLERAMQLLRS